MEFVSLGRLKQTVVGGTSSIVTQHHETVIRMPLSLDYGFETIPKNMQKKKRKTPKGFPGNAR